jgi:peptide/nickel transport system permease protein
MTKPRLIDRMPVVHQLRQSVGLQRGMLVAGLVLTGVFVLCAIFAPLIAPYGYAS